MTVQSIKSFGKDGETFPANELYIGTTPASTAQKATNTVTLHHGTKQLRFSAATDSAFQSADVADAVVRRLIGGPSLMVTKTVPDVSTIVTGSTSILDLIHTDLGTNPLTIYAPGGIIEFDIPDNFPFSDGDLEGDTSEGVVAEELLDFSLTPAAYLPLHSSDSPQTTPQLISTAKTELTGQNSVFNRMMVKYALNPTGLSENGDMLVANSQKITTRSIRWHCHWHGYGRYVY